MWIIVLHWNNVFNSFFCFSINSQCFPILNRLWCIEKRFIIYFCIFLCSIGVDWIRSRFVRNIFAALIDFSFGKPEKINNFNVFISNRRRKKINKQTVNEIHFFSSKNSFTFRFPFSRISLFMIINQSVLCDCHFWLNGKTFSILSKSYSFLIFLTFGLLSISIEW